MIPNSKLLAAHLSAPVLCETFPGDKQFYSPQKGKP